MNILDYYKYAQLATAAYVRLGGGPRDGATFARLASSREQDRIPLSIATELFNPANPDAARWSIAHYHGGDVPGFNDTTGLGATLFKRDGENVLAIRGVEPTVSVSDAARDLLGASIGGIGLLGVALNQLVDLVNLSLRLYGTGPVQQLRANISLTDPGRADDVVVVLNGVSIPSPVPGLPDISSSVFLSLRTETGAGLGLLAPGEKITLTGHSLGGHLAMAAAQLLGDRVNPDVYVYNSAGFDPSSVNTVSAASSLFRFLGPAVVGLLTGAKTALAESLGVGSIGLSTDSQQASGSILAAIRQVLGTMPATGTVHNLESEDSLPGDDQSVVASMVTGASDLAAKKLVGTEINSHSVEQLMDALALQAVLHRLDNTLELPMLKKFVDAANAKPEQSEESLIEALHVMLIPGSRFAGGSQRLPVSDASTGFGLNDLWAGKGALSARDAQHTALLEINRRLDEMGALTTRVISLSEENGQPLTPEQVAQRAASSPDALAYRYALKHLLPFAVTGIDYQTLHNQSGELDLYTVTATARTGTLTQDWLTDRAKLLHAELLRNTQDTPERALLPTGDTVSEYHFYRNNQEEIFFAEPQGTLPNTLPTRVVQFADDSGRLLRGTEFVLGDRLYGGHGTDYLEGRAGNDHLEGGRGLDLYNYNVTRNLLIGGPSYSGNGADTLRDIDGKGVLRVTNINRSKGTGVDFFLNC